MSKLPETSELLRALDWLYAGAPSASRHYDAVACVKILLRLIDALPAYLPRYCYGTDESKASARRTSLLFAEEQLILSVSETLYEEMNRQGLAPADLAVRLDMPVGLVEDQLNGMREMTVREAAAYAWALGLSMGEALPIHDDVAERDEDVRDE